MLVEEAVVEDAAVEDAVVEDAVVEDDVVVDGGASGRENRAGNARPWSITQ